MSNLRFYLDENVPIAVARQLVQRDIDVVTVLELGALGDSDIQHLTVATEMQCVLCTHDMDFVQLAQNGATHTGIIVAVGRRTGVGDWVRGLIQFHARWQSKDFLNRVEFL